MLVSYQHPYRRSYITRVTRVSWQWFRKNPYSSPGQAGHEYSVRFTESTRNSTHFSMINHVNKWNFQSSFKAKGSFGLKPTNTTCINVQMCCQFETKTRPRKIISLFEVQWRNHEGKIHYMARAWPLLETYSKILSQSRIVILWNIH